MIRTRRILLTLALVSALFVGCDDDGNGDDFLLRVRVLDPAGAPMEGLDIFMDIPLPELFPGVARSAKRPRTKFRFDVPQAATVQVRIYDLEDRLVRTLLEDGFEAQAGAHELTFDGRTDDNDPARGTVVHRLELTARDSQSEEILFQDEIHPVLVTWPDREQAPLLGRTDANGIAQTADRIRFPFLYELPELVLTDFEGNDRGTFTIPDSVSVFITDPTTQESMSTGFRVGSGRNVFDVEWAPTAMVARVQEDSRFEPTSTPVKTVPGPIARWRLYPNIPNPFN